MLSVAVEGHAVLVQALGVTAKVLEKSGHVQHWNLETSSWNMKPRPKCKNTWKKTVGRLCVIISCCFFFNWDKNGVLLLGRPTLDPVAGTRAAIVTWPVLWLLWTESESELSESIRFLFTPLVSNLSILFHLLVKKQSLLLPASVSNPMLLHMNLDVMLPMAMKVSRAAPLLMAAAPALFGAGPAVVPVLEACVAVVGLHHMDHFLPMAAATVLMRAAPSLLGMGPQMTPILATKPVAKLRKHQHQQGFFF